MKYFSLRHGHTSKDFYVGHELTAKAYIFNYIKIAMVLKLYPGGPQKILVAIQTVLLLPFKVLL